MRSPVRARSAGERDARARTVPPGIVPAIAGAAGQVVASTPKSPVVILEHLRGSVAPSLVVEPVDALLGELMRGAHDGGARDSRGRTPWQSRPLPPRCAAKLAPRANEAPRVVARRFAPGVAWR